MLVSHAHRQVIVSLGWIELRARLDMEAVADLWRKPLPRYLPEIKAADNHLPISVKFGRKIKNILISSVYLIINLITDYQTLILHITNPVIQY